MQTTEMGSWRAIAKSGALILLAAPAVLLVSSPSSAQQRVETVRTVEVVDVETEARADHDSRPHIGFVEATAGYGIQFGVADYLPSGAVGQYAHPIVHGYAVGGTLGVMLIPGLALVGNYEFQRSISRHGDIPGVVSEVGGSIEYHTITIGPRLYVALPFGAIQAELAVGVVLPYEIERSLTYGPALAAAGIMGTGTSIDSYDIGFGGHALVGYNVPLGDVMYLALNFKLRTFQGENSGSTTELRNYADLTQQPPQAVDGVITYGNGAARPSTHSVQDARLQLAVGARF